MKILFLELSREKNIEYEVTHLLASHAGSADFEAHVIAQGTSKILGEKQVVEKQIGPLNFYYANFGRDLSLRPWPSKLKRAWMMFSRLPVAVKLIWRVIRSLRPDFIYTSQQRFDVLAARIIRRLTGIPHIMHIYYQIGPNLGPNVFDELKKTPYLLTCSEYNLEKAEKWGLARESVALCPNPIEATLFDVPREPDYMQKRFGFPPGAPIVLSVGRVDPDKRIDITLRAFAQALKVVPEARLLVCGESYLFPNYSQKLVEMVRAMGLDQQVVLAGFVSDLPQILANSDIFCLPSESDVFSVAICEAMAAGLPVLSARDGGTPEIVVEGETGLLCKLDDVDELAFNMERLLKDRKLAQQMGKAGKERILKYLTPQIVGSHWMDLMRKFYKAQYK